MGPETTGRDAPERPTRRELTLRFARPVERHRPANAREQHDPGRDLRAHDPDTLSRRLRVELRRETDGDVHGHPHDPPRQVQDGCEAATNVPVHSTSADQLLSWRDRLAPFRLNGNSWTAPAGG